MLFYLIALLIMLYSFVDYKKGFFIFLAYKLILVQNITIISIPGIPLLTLEMFMNIFFVCLYCFKRKFLKKSKISFPFVIPFIFISICWILSSLFSAAGVISELSALIGNILNEFLLLVIMWNVIETKKDFAFIFNLITIIILFSCIYGLYEYQVQNNPIISYEITLNHDPDKIIDFRYDPNSMRGYRTQSIFEHTIGAGMTWALYSAFVFMITVDYNIKVKVIPMLTAMLCIPMILLTKQRSGIVFFLILAFTFLKARKKKTYFILFPAAIGVLMLLFSGKISNSLQIVLSIFNPAYQQTVSGSNVSMRIRQLSAAFKIMLKSPIWGNGSKFRNVLNDPNITLLLGGESIWFTVIPAYGLLGLLAYISNIYYGIYIIPKRFKSSNLFWVMTAYWLVYTLTSIPGFKTYLLYLVVIYILKASNRYRLLEPILVKD